MKSKEMKKQIKEFLKGKTVTSWTHTEYSNKCDGGKIKGSVNIDFEFLPEPNRVYKVGDKITVDQYRTYIIGRVGTNLVCLISILDGNYYEKPFKVKDDTKITTEELDDHIEFPWTCE